MSLEELLGKKANSVALSRGGCVLKYPFIVPFSKNPSIYSKHHTPKGLAIKLDIRTKVVDKSIIWINNKKCSFHIVGC